MCGIAGVYKIGKAPIREEMIASFLTGNEHRGNDAAGIAILQPKGVIVTYKKDITPWEFVKSPGYLKFIEENLNNDTIAVIVHARGASQGNPRDNNNNHPMYQGLSAVVHNGVIRNDTSLFLDLKLQRKAETDSDLLRAILDADGFTEKSFASLNRIVGGVATLAFHPQFPDRLLVARSGNPLVPASNDDFFVFASEKNTIHRAMRPYIKRHGVWFQATRPTIDFGVMPNHTLWIIGPKGLETHTRFFTHAGDFHEPNRRVYSEYASRSARFDKGAEEKKNVHAPVRVMPDKKDASKDFAWCQKCQKEYLIPAGAKASDYICPPDREGCGSELVPVRKQKGASVS